MLDVLKQLAGERCDHGGRHAWVGFARDVAKPRYFHGWRPYRRGEQSPFLLVCPQEERTKQFLLVSYQTALAMV